MQLQNAAYCVYTDPSLEYDEERQKNQDVIKTKKIVVIRGGDMGILKYI